MFLVDSTAPDRFEESKAALDRVLASCDVMGAPLLVLANKQDVPGCLSSLDIQEFYGVGPVDSRPVRVAGISAYTGRSKYSPHV